MKRILILTYYGTIDHKKGTEIYEKIKNEFTNKFPDFFITQCFNSKRIVKKLGEVHGIKLETLNEKLEFFKNSEISENNLSSEIKIFVQPIYLTEGTQYEEILETTNNYKSFFLNLEVGTPLFNDFDSLKTFTEVLEKKYTDFETAYIFVGHGSQKTGKYVYGALGYVFQLKHPNFFTATIEDGIPLSALENTILRKYKKVCLVPLLLVPGYHFKQDIQKKFLNFFIEKNIEVKCIETSLGEDSDFITLFFNPNLNTL
ncbi:MAG: sirohydrochlorin cobaltochelatase [Fusobacteriaceae bacterium]